MGAVHDGRVASLIGVALFAYYLLILGGHHYSIDGIVTFQAAKQLWFRQSFLLDPPVKWGPDVVLVNRFSVGFMLAYFPALALMTPLAHWMPSLRATPYDPTLARNPELYGNLAYLLCSWLNPLITALTGSLVFLLSRRLGMTPAWAAIAALTYGVASPAAAYARYDFSQPLAGLLLAAAVYALIDAIRHGRLRSFVRAGAWLGAMILTRPDLGVLIAWIGPWLAAGVRRSGLRAAALRLSAVAVSVLAAAALYLLTNHARFGDWTHTGYAASTLFPQSRWEVLEGAFGLLVSPGHGVLIFYPLAWLAVPGLHRLVKEHHPAGALCSGLVPAALALYAAFPIWWAGWSWGPRFLVPLLPLLAVAATFWAFRGWQRRLRWRTGLFAGLAVLGAVISWNGVLVDPVLHYRWVQNALGLPETSATQFVPAASPLVSGWGLLATTPVDLLLLRTGEFAGRPGIVAGALIASVLLGGLFWSARGILEALRGRVSS